MRNTLFVIAAVLALATADKYAIIVGAADSFSNYASESCACRMYDDVLRAGIPKENIINMNYVTGYETGPKKGQIFTDPAEDDSGDWAKYGCFDNLDYKDKQLTPESFLGVISGDAERVRKATGIENPRVLSATEKDTVFVYFIDHGGDGVIYVSSKPVYRKDLEKALETAYEKKLYGKMVFFLESCHSGSMFEGFEEKYNIFIETAANPDRNANKSNCPPNDYIGNVHIGTCIGSLWDNFFMEYMEQNEDKTFDDVYQYVKEQVAKTSKQDPQIYGKMAMKDEQYKEYIGVIPPYNSKQKRVAHLQKELVPNHLVAYHSALWRSIRANNDIIEKRNAYSELYQESSKLAMDEVVAMRIGTKVFGEKKAFEMMERIEKEDMVVERKNIDCYQETLKKVMNTCSISVPPTPIVYNMLHSICNAHVEEKIDFDSICF